VARAGGSDRYATAVAVSRTAFSPATPAGYLATGLAYPDALAAVAAVARQRGPLLLTAAGAMPAVVAGELTRLHPTRLFLLGSSSVVGVPVAKAAQRLLGVCWSANRPPAGSAQYLSSIPAASGRMALTFDMGGRLDPAVSIVNYLIDQQVCATLFLTGSASQTTTGRQVMALIAAHPELFEVGNHTVHHCDLVIGKQSAGSPYCPTSRPSSSFMVKELTDAASIIQAGTGQNPRPYWRAPYGASDSGVRATAASAGYTKTIQWNIDTIDWSTSTTTDQIVSRVLSKASGGSIVLMHLGGYHTRDALPMLISSLRARGYTLTTLSDMLD
jgi:peptidoglycan/xylan/chitin deacetylase (PgdA/CDA1 family)